jgi:hypothetical protein
VCHSGHRQCVAWLDVTFDPARRSEAINAYNSVEGILHGYGYVTGIAAVPADSTPYVPEVVNQRDDAQAPTDTVAQPAADAGASAPQAPAEAAAPVEQPAPDAA